MTFHRIVHLGRKRLFALVATVAACMAWPACADEAAIRKNLVERMPSLPKVDEVSKTPIAGIWEVRIGSEILYTDEQANYLISGTLFDTRNKVDITTERLDRLSAFNFSALPLKDALVIKQGSGARKLVVFADPNCGYCKRLERDLLKLKDVTIYTFLYPVLGKDSLEKSRNIWCSADAAKAWRDWMIDARMPVAQMGNKCDASALERNTELGRKHRVEGTPAIVFEDNSRKPGAVPLAEIEKILNGIKGSGAAPKS